MSNSQEQSLDEHAVFLPVFESNPEFLHCERERRAVERLLGSGPGAFYASLAEERLGPFLSPEEASRIAGWTRDYQVSRVQLENGEETEENEGEVAVGRGYSERYFPAHSDTPAPVLELGWPEKVFWVGGGHAAVHTDPPADGRPPIRVVIRRLLHAATKVIAIATDRLTDSAVTVDLHHLASRGVPVYIILNQRSVQENFTPHRLRHPNIRVRALGGKTYCSREGKVVVGEMKDNFLLVDLETVVHGSYSLTWSDAHLHRQLVTVLSGPAVDSFDTEFRILFAASLPVPDAAPAERLSAEAGHRSESTDLGRPRYLPLEPVVRPASPPSPASPLDWEALGVLRRDPQTPDAPVNQLVQPVVTEEPPDHPMTLEKKTAVVKDSDRHKTAPADERKPFVDPTFVTKSQQDNQANLRNTQQSETDLQSSAEKETQNRVHSKIERGYFRHLFRQRSSESDGTLTSQPSQDNTEPAVLSPRQRRDRPIRREDVPEEELNPNGPSASRKPVILRVVAPPQTEGSSCLSDILKRLQPRPSARAQITRASKTTVSELSRSTMDLSRHGADTRQERGPPVPRLQTSYFDAKMTPALALMKKRNDLIKSEFLRQPKTFIPHPRPRSSSFGLQRDWRRTQTDQDGKRDEAK